MRYEILTDDGRVYILAPLERMILDSDGHSAHTYAGEVIPEVGFNLFIPVVGETPLITSPVVSVTEHE